MEEIIVNTINEMDISKVNDDYFVGSSVSDLFNDKKNKYFLLSLLLYFFFGMQINTVRDLKKLQRGGKLEQNMGKK